MSKFILNSERRIVFSTNLDEPFIFDTHASTSGIGGVVPQKIKAYFSKSLSKAERNSYVTRKDQFEVIKWLQHFHKYLYGQRFLLRVDP